jgi:glycosyltransferase involved in cell wall biosynthesis
MGTKLSVAVITRGRPTQAEQLLQRLSSWVDIGGEHELIVSDDSDHDILREAAARSGARYFHDPRRLGQFANASSAVARSIGEWVVVAHDDDDLFPGLVDVVNAAPDDAVIATGLTESVGGLSGVGAAHKAKLRALGLPAEKPLDGAKLLPEMLIHGNPLVFSTTAFRRDAAIDVGLFDPTLRCVGDWEFWLRLLPRGKIVFQDVVVGRYVTHANNNSQTAVAGRDRRIELPLAKVEALLRNPEAAHPKIVSLLGRQVRTALTKSVLQRHRLDLVVRLAVDWRELRKRGR